MRKTAWAARVRDVMDRLGCSLSEFAEALKRKPATVRRWLRGTGRPGGTAREKIEHYRVLMESPIGMWREAFRNDLAVARYRSVPRSRWWRTHMSDERYRWFKEKANRGCDAAWIWLRNLRRRALGKGNLREVKQKPTRKSRWRARDAHI